jgi:hypothetical protein
VVGNIGPVSLHVREWWDRHLRGVHECVAAIPFAPLKPAGRSGVEWHVAHQVLKQVLERAEQPWFVVVVLDDDVLQVRHDE